MRLPGRIGLGLLFVALAAGQAAAAPPLVGIYTLVQDDDGTTPRADAQVSLAFNADGSVVLSAIIPGTTISDKGTWSIVDGKLTMLLPESGKSIFQTKFSLNGRDVTLPFRVFSDEEGSS